MFNAYTITEFVCRLVGSGRGLVDVFTPKDPTQQNRSLASRREPVFWCEYSHDSIQRMPD